MDTRNKLKGDKSRRSLPLHVIYNFCNNLVLKKIIHNISIYVGWIKALSFTLNPPYLLLQNVILVIPR